MGMLRTAGVVLAMLVLLGCSKPKQEVKPISVTGEKAKAGATLAYEHRVTINVDADAIGPRMAAVRDACGSARFGACNLLQIEQSGNDRYARNQLELRVAPAAVEPLVTLAAQGGAVGARETMAEDLADAVADNGRQRELIEKQQARLQELQGRKDLAVADLIALGHEQATLEVTLQDVQRQTAEQQHRLDTNLLTLRFSADRESSRWGRLGQAFTGLPDALVNGIEQSMEWLGEGLPFLILAFPLALLWRWAWRRTTRAGDRGKL